MDKSTPRPWGLETGRGGWWTIADEANGWVLGQRSEWPSRAEMSSANAALIVRAVNAFDALIDALREAEDFISTGHENLSTGHVDADAAGPLRMIRAALALAKET